MIVYNTALLHNGDDNNVTQKMYIHSDSAGEMKSHFFLALTKIQITSGKKGGKVNKVLWDGLWGTGFQVNQRDGIREMKETF